MLLIEHTHTHNKTTKNQKNTNSPHATPPNPRTSLPNTEKPYPYFISSQNKIPPSITNHSNNYLNKSHFTKQKK
jgi:hypothetical protein